MVDDNVEDEPKGRRIDAAQNPKDRGGGSFIKVSEKVDESNDDYDQLFDDG